MVFLFTVKSKKNHQDQMVFLVSLYKLEFQFHKKALYRHCGFFFHHIGEGNHRNQLRSVFVLSKFDSQLQLCLDFDFK
jgi:hypothetical protein